MCADLAIRVQFVIGGDAEPGGLWGPENHGVSLVATTKGNSREGLSLEVGSGSFVSVHRIRFSPEVTDTSKAEQGAHPSAV